jgi:DNA-binding MarR family transcriptional regulator
MFKINHEIPMVNPMQDLLLATRYLYEAVYRFDASVATQMGIHLSDLRCVNALESGPLSAGAIGERLGLTSGSVTALIGRLERAGFVVKTKDAQDGRQVQVSLQPEFYQHAADIYAQLGESLSEQFQELSADEIRYTIQAIERLTRGFQQGAGQSLSNETAQTTKAVIAICRHL